ncbi:MAG: energy transducer TonB [Terracidiphilus sp.]|jgi:TonB family protein
MRKAGLLLTLLALSAGPALAQQELAPSTDDGPLAIKPVQPKPDKDGVYSAGPGILSPLVLQRGTAVYPENVPADAVDGVCVLSLVVDADGTPTKLQVVATHGAAFDAAASDAVKQFKFEPGTLDGKPVPVRIYARIRFFDDRRPAIPRMLSQYDPSGVSTPLGARSGGFSPRPRFPSRPYDKFPIAIYAPAAEYSEQARAAKFQGVVMVSVLVTEEGLPADIKVLKPVGMGLDEKAIECVSQYRFKPAMKDGAPVAARITVEVNYRMY